jgi:hypothetical protein
MLVGRADEGDDDAALAEVLRRAAGAGTRGAGGGQEAQGEWATFAVYLFRSDPVRVVEAISRMTVEDREAVAEVLVTSSLALFSGEPGAVSAPWPTHRLPEAAVPISGRRGWRALAAAERGWREGGPR